MLVPVPLPLPLPLPPNRAVAISLTQAFVLTMLICRCYCCIPYFVLVVVCCRTEQSLRLDPYLLEMEDVLEKWLDHFDGTKGTHVCLIDSLDPTTAAAADAAAGGAGGDGDRGSGGGGGSGDNRSRSGSGGVQRQRNTGIDGDSNSNSRSRSHSNSSKAKPAVSGQIIEDPLWRRLLFGEGETTSPPAVAVGGAGGGTDWANAKNSDDSSGAQGQGRGKADGGAEGASGDHGFGAARVSVGRQGRTAAVFCLILVNVDAGYRKASLVVFFLSCCSLWLWEVCEFFQVYHTNASICGTQQPALSLSFISPPPPPKG